MTTSGDKTCQRLLLAGTQGSAVLAQVVVMCQPSAGQLLSVVRTLTAHQVHHVRQSIGQATRQLTTLFETPAPCVVDIPHHHGELHGIHLPVPAFQAPDPFIVAVPAMIQDNVETRFRFVHHQNNPERPGVPSGELPQSVRHSFSTFRRAVASLALKSDFTVALQSSLGSQDHASTYRIHPLAGCVTCLGEVPVTSSPRLPGLQTAERLVRTLWKTLILSRHPRTL